MAGLEMCEVNGCWQYSFARGWCRRHYTRWYRHGDPLYNKHRERPKRCMVPECVNPHYGRRLCEKHYYRAYRANLTPSPEAIRKMELDQAREILSRYDLAIGGESGGSWGDNG